jgi:hypothetical protein
MKSLLAWAEKVMCGLMKKIRKHPRVRHCLLVVLPCVLIVACITPHILTRETTLEAAGAMCEDNYTNRAWENNFDHNFSSFEDAVVEFDKNANNKLHVQHPLNMTAACFSVFSFLLWCFFTAHSASSASQLDQTGAPHRRPSHPPRPPPPLPPSPGLFLHTLTPFAFVPRSFSVGCFHFLQVVGNIGVSVSSAGYICSSTQAMYQANFLVWQAILFGISIFSTNLAFHRYLLKKAKAMARM